MSPTKKLIEAMDKGPEPGTSLAELLDSVRREIVKATIVREPTLNAAARSLGMTREALYKLRRRYGFHVGPSPADMEILAGQKLGRYMDARSGRD